MLVAIDTETTGLNPFVHDILVAAFVPFDDCVEPLQVFVEPRDLTWSETAYKYFQYYKEDWEAHKKPAKYACASIERWIAQNFQGPITLVGHNVGFDLGFLRALAYEGARDQIEGISHRSVDTHSLLYALYEVDCLPEHALTSSGAFEHFDIPVDGRHTALGDAIATRELYERILLQF